jgi:hypothetical protein
MVIWFNFHAFWGLHILQINGKGDKRSGNTTMLDVQTLLETWLYMYVRSASLIDKPIFFWLNAKLPPLGLLKYQVIRSQMNRILLY